MQYTLIPILSFAWTTSISTIADVDSLVIWHPYYAYVHVHNSLDRKYRNII